MKSTEACTGDLQLYLSPLMPYAFAALTREFVILGLFIATSSYAAGPMIVVQCDTNRHLSETLRKDWNARLRHVQEQISAGTPETDQPTRGVVSDAHFITEIEGKLPKGTSDVWIAAPDLANVGDEKDFSELVRSVVNSNAKKGINYTYICPEREAGRARKRNLDECFKGTPGKLDFCEIASKRFQEITLVKSHFITFNPNAKHPEVYMQLPLAEPQKGWIKLNRMDARNIVDKMKEVIGKRRVSAPPTKAVKRRR